MDRINLRKIKSTDQKYFSAWWRDKELIKLTSGVFKFISDKEIENYFKIILARAEDLHFIITLNKKVIGHISLVKRRNNWHETQIIISQEKWGKGYGTRAINILKRKAKRLGIEKVYLEVRPTNTRAIRVYEKCGFQKVKTVLHPKDKYLPETLRMELGE